MRTWGKRAFFVAACIAGTFFIGANAHAQTGVCSRANLHSGDSISVNGSGATPGETAQLLFNGSTIGAGTVDGFGNFTISGDIPNSATAGSYPITVTFSVSAPIAPCTVTVDDSPGGGGGGGPTPTATSTAVPDDTPEPDRTDRPDRDPQQQQQQQQQQQTVFVPVALPAPQGHNLPTTGAEVGDFAGAGFGSLALGLTFVGATWRRRRRKTAVVPAVPDDPPDGDSEGTLLLPYW